MQNIPKKFIQSGKKLSFYLEKFGKLQVVKFV